MKEKKPIYKRWWVLLIGVFVALAIIGALIDDGEKETADKAEIKKDLVETKEEKKKESVDTEDKEDHTVDEDEVTWDDLKNKDKIIGKSDKDFTEGTEAKPNKVRNDSTGNWRITKISESIPIEEYALSYYNEYMGDGEVHFIVNFNYNTTTTLNMMSSLLYVDVKEYVKKEEHDAKTLGSGMPLKSYVIYPDGDIEEIE